MTRSCANPKCQVEFQPTRPWQKYHAKRCRYRHWLLRKEERAERGLTCPHCGKPLAEGARRRREDGARKKKSRRGRQRRGLRVEVYWIWTSGVAGSRRAATLKAAATCRARA